MQQVNINETIIFVRDIQQGNTTFALKGDKGTVTGYNPTTCMYSVLTDGNYYIKVKYIVDFERM